jgi:mono/diheme cytochrome c family protein
MKSLTRESAALAIAALAFGFTAVSAEVQKETPKPVPKTAAKPKITPGQEKALENYKKVCMQCHGPDGKSQLPGMTLADGEWKHGSSLDAIAKTISEGVPKTLMLPNKDKFTPEEIRELAKLVRSFDPKFKKP